MLYTVAEVAFSDASGTHAISELTSPLYQSQIRMYTQGTWRIDGANPPALQLGYNGDTKVRVSNTVAFDVNILKTGEDNTHGLAGAHFELYGSNYYLSDGATINPEAQPVKSNLISRNDGKIALGMLNTGAYFLVETQAPPGYNLLAKPVKIEVDPTGILTKTVGEGSGAVTYPLYVTYHYYLGSGDEANLSLNHDGISVQMTSEGGGATYSYTLTVPNTSGVSLPSTGGSGTHLIYLLGIMLAGFSGAGLVMRKRRRRNAA